MKSVLISMLAASAALAFPAGAQTLQGNDITQGSDADSTRELQRRDVQRQILMENASREQRRVIQMQRLRDAGSSRRASPRPPESAPATVPQGTVRTQ